VVIEEVRAGGADSGVGPLFGLTPLGRSRVALKVGKHEANTRVERSLYRKAVGYDYPVPTTEFRPRSRGAQAWASRRSRPRLSAV
jgi:hypothetical protein